MSIVHIIAGPTASGKSAKALELAQSYNGVIINADSLQIYSDLPILSACPDAEEQAAAPHRLYAFLGPEETYSAQKWREDAETEIRTAHENGQLPILCGGTGFYIQALTKGLSPIPDIDEHHRAHFTALARAEGSAKLHEYLTQYDPKTAARLHPNDTQRLIRACEVHAGTDQPISHWQTKPRIGAIEGVTFKHDLILPPRDELYQRCNLRFEKMVHEWGVLDEVKAVLEKIETSAIAKDAPITRTLGFKELASYLKGETSLDEAITRAQTETRHYAKRQRTFFSNQDIF